MVSRREPFSAAAEDAPVFVISVAAELTGMHPQTLRTYDRMGLVRPGRAVGGGRRYSLRDIALLRTVADLTSAGIGIEGVRRILELESQLAALHARVAELEAELVETARAMPNLPVVRSRGAVTRWEPRRVRR
jgi:MerR family transcriptional regulator, heat shock protein HspR